YGKGLGSWLTKILMDPHTARLALARSPQGALHFLRNARNHSLGKSDAEATAPAPRDPRIAKALRTELISVARGPLNYLLERRSGKT
ncbi:hypothetical protein, partial [Campylobacter coli]|uniref:hypothetical protein n=1 Tax=Campylobacter coli TaxID=195 RepID=UPI003CE692C7